jgi:hypothetical protein
MSQALKYYTTATMGLQVKNVNMYIVYTAYPIVSGSSEYLDQIPRK